MAWYRVARSSSSVAVFVALGVALLVVHGRRSGGGGLGFLLGGLFVALGVAPDLRSSGSAGRR